MTTADSGNEKFRTCTPPGDRANPRRITLPRWCTLIPTPTSPHDAAIQTAPNGPQT